VAPVVTAPPSVQLVATAYPPAGGLVSPASGIYAAGATVEVSATPATYYRFLAWTNGAVGTNNPLTLLLNTNVSIQAVFTELFTTNHPTPYAWLAAHGYTSNFENVVEAAGANGIPIWQSYIAGLDPNDPNSQLRLTVSRDLSGAPKILNWNTVTGRLYTLWWKTNLTSPFMSAPGASNLAAKILSFTNGLSPAPPALFYRMEVRQP
jgi:hypothetical protein